MVKNLVDMELFRRNQATPEFKAWLEAFTATIDLDKLKSSSRRVTRMKPRLTVIKGNKK